MAGQVEDGSIDGRELGIVDLAAVKVLLDPGDDVQTWMNGEKRRLDNNIILASPVSRTCTRWSKREMPYG